MTEYRTFPSFSDEAFKKIQDLQAVVANNNETISALNEAIEVHRAGLELLVGDTVEPIRVQFENIIDNFQKSKSNLITYNDNANNFINLAKETTDPNVLEAIERLLTIVAFK